MRMSTEGHSKGHRRWGWLYAHPLMMSCRNFQHTLASPHKVVQMMIKSMSMNMMACVSTSAWPGGAPSWT